MPISSRCAVDKASKMPSIGGKQPPLLRTFLQIKKLGSSEKEPPSSVCQQTFLLPRVLARVVTAGGVGVGWGWGTPLTFADGFLRPSGGSSGLSDCLKSGTVIHPFFSTFPAFVSPSVFHHFKTLSSYGDLNYNHLDTRQALA